jgi:hypothetical protein
MRRASAAAVTGPFIARATELGIRAPLRLLDHDARAWPLPFPGDPLLVDEYGDLWWGRIPRAGEARVTRPVWPEEFSSRADEIARALATLLDG